MEYIKWKDELSVELESIDSQHKELFRLINAFYDCIVNKANKKGMMQVINDLENYTIIHFACEEEMMQKSNYPGLSAHMEEHQKFIETVSNYRNRFNEGRLLLSLEVTGFIKSWITDHIMKTDQLYKGKIQ